MGGYPNFKEFYQKCPIQMGKNDLITVKQQANVGANSYTHWLIALEGNEINEKTIRWKVVIFPSEENGCNINYKAPYYTSPMIPSFHEAYQLSSKLTSMAQQDQLTSSMK